MNILGIFVGFLFMLGVLPLAVGGTAVLVLGWSDGLAAVVGRAAHVGEFQIWGRTESLAGIGTRYSGVSVGSDTMDLTSTKPKEIEFVRRVENLKGNYV
jgi:hypothetical protein